MTGRKRGSGEYSLAWPILTAALHLSSVRGDTRGEGQARSLCPLLDPYLLDSVSKRKAFGGRERSRNAILIGRNERWTRNNYERQTRLCPPDSLNWNLIPRLGLTEKIFIVEIREHLAHPRLINRARIAFRFV